MKNELRLEVHKKAIVIVAHPDDETIWMGGTVLSNPQVDWTIFSLCRQSDADREPKFQRVCRRLGAEAIICDLDDEGRLDFEEACEQAEQMIRSVLEGKEFAYLFTHWKNGEYGHPGHKAVHQAVKNLLDKKAIRPEAVFYFSYKKNKADAPLVVALADSHYLVDLPRELIEEKRRIVAEMYGYPYDGIDVNYCTDPEAFRKS